jgi:hypothetical protein
MIGGAVTFSVAYAAGVTLAMMDGFENGTSWFLAPIIGPWAAIAARDNPCKTFTIEGRQVVDVACIDDALQESFTIVLFTLDGLLQATGGSLFIIGLASTQRQLVRSDVATHAGPRRHALVPSWTVAPVRFGSKGFGLVGTARF